MGSTRMSQAPSDFPIDKESQMFLTESVAAKGQYNMRASKLSNPPPDEGNS